MLDLNPSQQAVAEFEQGIALVVAVAGSGKTKTMISRALNLIQKGVLPQHIWMTTFTNKAAKEIKERLLAKNDQASAVQVGTFHSFCLKMFKQNQLSLESTIIDQDDIEQTFKMLLAQNSEQLDLLVDIKPRTIYEVLSYATNTCSSVEAAILKKAPSLGPALSQIEELQRQYQKFKKDQKLLDFDDIILDAINYLDSPSGQYIKNQCQYLIVDEFQDTNKLQFELIKKLTQTHQNLMCVGDDAQSIYSFRGANPQQLEEFLLEYPGLKVFKLEENYRSTQGILDVGNYVLAKMDSTIKKSLISANMRTDLSGVTRLDVADEYAQTDKMLEIISNSKQYSDICVLIKYGYQSAGLEIKLLAHKIPYVKYGGLKFLDKKHIKDVISFLKLKVNKKDQLAAMRCLMHLPGIGIKSAQALYDKYLEAQSWEKIFGGHKLNANPLAVVLQKMDKEISLNDALSLTISAYAPILEKSADTLEKLNSNKQDLEELKKVAKEYASVSSFINDVVLGESAIEATTAHNSVLISTIHSIKGLERNHVLIPNVYDGVYPRYTSSKEDAEEEKRLFYVAVTRAKFNLTLIKPFMNAKREYTVASPFLPKYR